MPISARVPGILLAMILLSACATQPLYSPAEDPESTGYWETRLSDNRYRVSFIGYANTPGEEVKNLALLRAAELTLDAGYDWFEIVERETREGIRRGEPRVSIGVGTGCAPFGCRIINSRWYTGVNVDSLYYGDRYRTSMEIRMGSGKPEDPNRVYDAAEVAAYLQDNLPDAPDVNRVID
ncbi:hypothetical protein F6455_18295 [Proteobacteria bacterium 005FR1]|nr:hypothetical protein [Proteobacteria bacterium 005FR1]